ncbi:MAG: rhodanese [Planctomycetales bacterium 12-60-4]|nr:MAG: rhodanese [Planctomycetales bacterium 12-60-4]
MSDVPLEISCREVHAKLAANESFYFVDCREADEYATAKIVGANLLPMSALAERVAELEPHKSGPIVVHCHHGGRSLRVVRWLRNQGFAQATSMAGGIDEWSQTIDNAVPRY